MRKQRNTDEVNTSGGGSGEDESNIFFGLQDDKLRHFFLNQKLKSQISSISKMIARKDARSNLKNDQISSGDSMSCDKLPLESQRHCYYYYNSPGKSGNTSQHQQQQLQQQQQYSQDDPSTIVLDSMQSVKDAVDAWDKEFYNKPIPTIESSDNDNEEDEKKNNSAAVDAFRRFYAMDNTKRGDRMKEMKNAYSAGGRTPSPLKKTPIRLIKGKICNVNNDSEHTSQQKLYLPSLGLGNSLKKRPFVVSTASPLRSNILATATTATGRDEMNQNKRKYGGSSSVEKLEMKNTINGMQSNIDKGDKLDVSSVSCRRSGSNREVGKIGSVIKQAKGQEENHGWKDCNILSRRFKEKSTQDQVVVNDADNDDGRGKKYQIYITNNVYGNEDVKKEKRIRKEEIEEEEKAVGDAEIVDRTDKIDRICKELLRNNENMISLAKEIDVFYGSDIKGKEGMSHRRKDQIYDKDSDSGQSSNGEDSDVRMNRRNKDDWDDRQRQKKVLRLKDVDNGKSKQEMKKNLLRNGQKRRKSSISESERDSEGDLSESDGDYGDREQSYTTPLRVDKDRDQRYLKEGKERDLISDQEDIAREDALMMMKYPILERNSGQSSRNFKKIPKRLDQQAIQVGGQIQSPSGLSSSQVSSGSSTVGSTSKKEQLGEGDGRTPDDSYPEVFSKWKQRLEKVQEEPEKVESNSEYHQSMAVTNNEFYQETKVDFQGNEEEIEEEQQGQQKQYWDEDFVGLNPWMMQMMKQVDNTIGQRDDQKNKIDVDGKQGIIQRTPTLGRRNPFLKIKK